MIVQMNDDDKTRTYRKIKLTIYQIEKIDDALRVEQARFFNSGDTKRYEEIIELRLQLEKQVEKETP